MLQSQPVRNLVGTELFDVDRDGAMRIRVISRRIDRVGELFSLVIGIPDLKSLWSRDPVRRNFERERSGLLVR